MIKVTKEEVEILRARAPQAHIAIVNRQSSHKKYYAEENRETTRILKELRGENDQDVSGKHQRNRRRGSGPRERSL